MDTRRSATVFGPMFAKTGNGWLLLDADRLGESRDRDSRIQPLAEREGFLLIVLYTTDNSTEVTT